MVELPEAVHLAAQLDETVVGQVIRHAEAAYTHHVWAWYSGDPSQYPVHLEGKEILSAENWGGFVVLHLSGGGRVLLGEGTNVRWFPKGTPLPAKHQLHLEFDSGSLVASVQMYGFLLLEEDEEPNNSYAAVAHCAPSPLGDDFDLARFQRLIDSVKGKTMPLKTFFATEQRIPGLGNGVLQDILFEARLHPRQKLDALTDAEIARLFASTKETLKGMAEQGGRDTELDLFGTKGGYKTRASRLTNGKPCPRCGSLIQKQAYLGGSVYTCPTCQRVD